MGGFRIGRKHAVHTYPESRTATTVPYARNFASTPKEDFALTDVETPIPWDRIDGGAPLWDAGVTYSTDDIVSFLGFTWISLVDNNTGNDPFFSPGDWSRNTVVPITPRSTGVVVIHGVLALENVSAGAEQVEGTIFVNGAPLLLSISEDLPSGETAMVPFLTQANLLAVGVTAHVEVALSVTLDGSVVLVQDSSTIEVREMQFATG